VQQQPAFFERARNAEKHRQRSQYSEKAVTHRLNVAIKNFRKRTRQKANRQKRAAAETGAKE